MLSGPPLSLASAINFSTASCGSYIDAIAATTSSSTTFQRPSEQSRKRSPGRIFSGPRTSGSTVSRTPTERIRTLLSGCRRASSSVIIPASTIRCTAEWSRVIRSTTPGRMR